MLTAFYILSSLLTLFYVKLIFTYIKGWIKTPEVFTDFNQEDQLKVSVLVAARNEEESLIDCLNSLISQSYSSDLFEIILLDDFSDDKTVEIASKFEKVKILRLDNLLDETFKNKPNKKRAISLGIEEAKHDIIITLDGDCVYKKHWLKSKIQCYAKTQAKMITSPVLFFSGKSIFSKFLELDLTALMGITLADIKNGLPSMVNGANLLFEKSVFLEVNGYEGNEEIASGDDVFLMQKIHKIYPNGIKFLKNKDAVAYTKSPQSFTDFVQQRIRWTSKSKKHADPKVRNTLILNVLFYMFLSFGIFVLPFFILESLKISFVLLVLKMIVDFVFFKNLTHFFQNQNLLRSFLVIELLHLPYISVLGLLSLLNNYTWKGRKI